MFQNKNNYVLSRAAIRVNNNLERKRERIMLDLVDFTTSRIFFYVFTLVFMPILCIKVRLGFVKVYESSAGVRKIGKHMRKYVSGKRKGKEKKEKKTHTMYCTFE